MKRSIFSTASTSNKVPKSNLDLYDRFSILSNDIFDELNEDSIRGQNRKSTKENVNLPSTSKQLKQQKLLSIFGIDSETDDQISTNPKSSEQNPITTFDLFSDDILRDIPFNDHPTVSNSGDIPFNDHPTVTNSETTTNNLALNHQTKGPSNQNSALAITKTSFQLPPQCQLKPRFPGPAGLLPSKVIHIQIILEKFIYRN